MLAICFLLSLLLYNPSISSPGFRAGPSIAVSRTNGPDFASFLLPSSSIFTSYFTCMTPFFVLCHIPSPCFRSCTPFLYGLSSGWIDFCFRPLRLLRFPAYNCHIIWHCASNTTSLLIYHRFIPQSLNLQLVPPSMPVLYACVSRLSLSVRAPIWMFSSVLVKPQAMRQVS